jgi:hypothetical protein
MNNIYGLLTNGKVTSEMSGYRYTDARRTTEMSLCLSSLMDDAGPVLGNRANFLLTLLRSSSLWPLFIHNTDPVNTYDIVGDVSDHGLTMQRLVSWAEQVPSTLSYYTHPGDDDVNFVITKLWSVLDGGLL